MPVKQKEAVKWVINEDFLTLYWEKEKAWGNNCEYVVMVNENILSTTQRTYCTFSLKEEKESQFPFLKLTESECRVQIRVREEEKILAELETSFQTESMQTGKKLIKSRIMITDNPYHAVGDGKTMNTERIQKAIDECPAGGQVYIPAGVFLTGALRLHSDMELYLEKGAVLQGTQEPKDYLPRIRSRFEGLEMFCYSSLLNLGELDRDGNYNCRNVVIRGEGTIAGGGKILAEKIIAEETEALKDYLAGLGEKIEEYEKKETIPGRVRPRLINLSNCQNIVLEGLTLKNSACWNVHMIYSDNIITHGCDFYSVGIWNGDGWNPDSSTNCAVFNCEFNTGDDAVSIKSGKNPEGNIINRPSRHICVFGCRCKIGNGITIGSEMSGGVEDVRIWDCDMETAHGGVEIKGTRKRGGYVRNVQVYDCVLSRVRIHSVAYNDDGIAAAAPPVFENCSFERVHIIGECLERDGKMHPCEPVILCGFEENGYEVKNIIFRNILFGKKNAGTQQKLLLKACKGVSFQDICCL